jgi:hypothetical protein
LVAPQRVGMTSRVSNTCRTAGLATGVAALGAAFQRHVATSLEAQLGHPAPRSSRSRPERRRALPPHPRWRALEIRRSGRSPTAR